MIPARADLSASQDLPRLANVARHEFFRRDVSCFERGAQAQRRLTHRFVGELEGAPVHCHGSAATAFDKGFDRFLWVHVHRLHDVARIIRADRDHAEIDRAMPLANFLKGRAIAGIACMPEFAVGILDQPPAPMAEVAVP